MVDCFLLFSIIICLEFVVVVVIMCVHVVVWFVHVYCPLYEGLILIVIFGKEKNQGHVC